ncbi:hypothetical protein M011DRAFT_62305 [Sporormia fimetaria CBS 119925]|uniref:CBF1-interacting co-repressor CIR N-terminal domain-containing protein n=1 Tax=Sporormia fimetaria CBS 119925 TaxID=1340428 RepID=A0A6A6VAG9_9PLEO|nr:hypothetical protein M011DRAFT_62305 [Sporormia fimetaria CBS 119925]
MQELDAQRRAAILRGRTPPPLPDESKSLHEHGERNRDRPRDGHDRKRRRVAGEDDTDRDIRLAQSRTNPERLNDAAILQLRKPESEAPLVDHAGNINLFPVDVKEAVKRDKNVEAEAEKRKKARELEDQYTMRLSNAAGREGTAKPWYATSKSQALENNHRDNAEVGFSEKDVWGNQDPSRKDREKARITSNDPLAFMQKAQSQLKKSQQDRRKWLEERDRELEDLRRTDESRRHHSKPKERRHRYDDPGRERERRSRHSPSRHRDRKRSRSASPRRSEDMPSRERHTRRSRSRDRDRTRHRRASQN